MNSQISQGFEIATWYDTWNPVGLNNLVNNLVPLHLASRYSLAFGQLSAIHSGGYCIEMSGKYADAIKDQLLSQAPGIELYAGIGSEGIQQALPVTRVTTISRPAILSPGSRTITTQG